MSSLIRARDRLRQDLADPAIPFGSQLVAHDGSLNYVAGTIGAALNDTAVNVCMFPWLAVGDGVTDDTAAVQAALNSGAARVIFPPRQFAWAGNGPTVPSNTHVVGHGAVIVQVNGDLAATISAGVEYCGFRVACGAENVRFEGFELRGPGYGGAAVPAYRSIGINISGRYDQYFYDNANYPANPPVAVVGTSKNIRIEGCTFDGWGQSGVIADQIDGFFARGNTIKNCTRDGIRLYGCKNFDVSENFIEGMAPGFPGEGAAPNNNVYGISATRIYHCTAGDGTLTDYRASSFGVIARNMVKDCPSWKAIDTHGGTDLLIIDNLVENAHIGIGLDKGGFTAADGYAPPRRIKVRGNHIVADPTNTAGNRCGIFAVAHDDAEENFGEDLDVSGNYVQGYGEDTRDGNVVVSNFRRGVLCDNIIKGGLRAGINFQMTVEDFAVRGGVIADVAMTTAAFLAGVAVQGASQRVSVDGVTFRKTDTADNMNAVSTVAPAAGYGVRLGDGCSFEGSVTPVPFPSHLVTDSPHITKTLAYANINNSGAAAILSSRGIASVNRTGVGVVEVTLSEAPLSAASVVALVTPKGSNLVAFVSGVVGSVITVQTRTSTTAASADGGFLIQVNGY